MQRSLNTKGINMRSCFIFLYLMASFVYASPPLVLAIDNNPPYSYIDEEGVEQGLSVNIFRLLAETVDFKPVFLHCPWARCIELIKSNEADLIIGVSRTKSREHFLHFVEPAFFTGKNIFSFYFTQPSVLINKYTDLKSLLVGTLRGSQYFPTFDQDKSLEKVPMKDMESLINMVLTGRLDTFIHLNSTVKPYLVLFDPSNKVKQANYTKSVQTHGYVAFSKSSTWLNRIDEFGQALETLIENKRIEQVFDKYKVK